MDSGLRNGERIRRPVGVCRSAKKQYRGSEVDWAVQDESGNRAKMGTPLLFKPLHAKFTDTDDG